MAAAQRQLMPILCLQLLSFNKTQNMCLAALAAARQGCYTSSWQGHNSGWSVSADRDVIVGPKDDAQREHSGATGGRHLSHR